LDKIEQKITQKDILIVSGVGGVGKTSVIKNLYLRFKNRIPFYVFKAKEFDVNKLSELLSNFRDFLNAHREEDLKIIVIDSCEKVLELKNTDPLKEFVALLVENNWKLIFTTRNNYLEDINYEFVEIHQITPFNINIEDLPLQQLENLSQRYDFVLPEDHKILDLIKNPFYLNEYLKFYDKEETLDYVAFKKKLWNRIIRRSKPIREQRFLEIAFQIADSSLFYFMPQSSDQIIEEFVSDGVLGYETAGYFITHDIYEEWAIERIIEREFVNKSSNQDFFRKIGESLPIRRCFRNWISEKLLLEDPSIKEFIEQIIQDAEIQSFWIDEVLVSILLSDYAETFFEMFSEQLDNQNLKKLTFLLRIACKEVDHDFLKHLGIKIVDKLSTELIFTKPRGKGWQCLIEFIFNNLERIGIENIHFVLPVVHDWNSKNKQGETTKRSSIIALKYYQSVLKEDIYISSEEDHQEKLFQTIIYGASEIKDILVAIFDEVLNNKWNRHRDPYYKFIKAILSKIEYNSEVIIALPEYVLKLADLFWSKIPVEKESRYSFDIGIEHHFGIIDGHQDYFPASSYQTPIYWLLKVSLKETVEFILSFTNKTVDSYAKSKLAQHEVKEINLYFEDGETTNQFVSSRLWNSYRGTQVCPDIFESIHMALEKFFLEAAKHVDSQVLQSWLLYLLKHARSASISSVVSSIVLAFPDKTFEIAKVLFKTKDFFIFDTERFLHDRSAKSLYSIGYGMNFRHQVHQDERIKTCDDKHRESSLETLALTYQFFKSKDISEEEVEIRQKTIWGIFDDYYMELNEKSQDTNYDKTWRLYLARMDRRKMAPSVEEEEGQITINFNPQIDPDLKDYSEKAVSTGSELMRYSSLNLWAVHKMKNDDEYKKYDQYNSNPLLALKEVKEIIECLHTSPNREFFLFNHAIPGHACSVLIRDHLKDMSQDEQEFCKDVILGVAYSSLSENYTYQISDGVESAISVLPVLLKEFPEEKKVIKTLLLVTLFNQYPIGNYCEFADYSKNAIMNSLWDISSDDAHSLLLGYLLLKPRHEQVRDKMREKNRKKGIYQSPVEHRLIKVFLRLYQSDLFKIVNNNIRIDDIDLTTLDLNALRIAFELIPVNSCYPEIKALAEQIITVFARDLLSNKREDRVDYSVERDFLKKLAFLVLNSSEQQEINNYLAPFITNFNNTEPMANLFKELISQQDKLLKYDNFWNTWNLFFKSIVDLCKTQSSYWYTDQIVKSYLFAHTPWREEAKEWHSLRENNKIFFKKIAENIGHSPEVLYSIAKLLNGIGSKYLNQGIMWISGMLRDNKSLWSDKLDNDTVYYLERDMRKFIFLNREQIRRTKQLKQDVLLVLDFLIEKGSVTGYMLRESIL
jgi:hypothetical protein